jgi:hypothetical protein
MSNVGKGAILGAIAMVAITLIWTAAAGTSLGEACPAPMCECSPVPRAAILGFGLVVGVPWGVLFGCALGWLAGRLVVYRRLVLAAAAPALALVLASITTPFMHCSTDPHGLALFARAFVPLAFAALALESWTRPRAPLPIAISVPRTR